VDKGSFGSVFKAFDMKLGGKEVALKISRNGTTDYQNAQTEIRILDRIRQKDPLQKFQIVRMLDSFSFRRHMVIVFEFLGENLYSYIKSDSFKGIGKEKLRDLAS